ncbi:MAG: hypothetical protein C4346_01990 [Chloroflexota bacterium]
MERAGCPCHKSADYSGVALKIGRCARHGHTRLKTSSGVGGGGRYDVFSKIANVFSEIGELFSKIGDVCSKIGCCGAIPCTSAAYNSIMELKRWLRK